MTDDRGDASRENTIFPSQERLMDVLERHYCGVYFVQTLEGFIHNLNSPLQILWIRSEQIQRDLQKLHEALGPGDRPELTEIVSRMQQRWDSLEKGMDDLNQCLNFLTNDVVMKARSEEGPVFINQVIRDTFSLLKADMFFKHQVQKDLQLDENNPKVRGCYSDFCVIAMHIIQNALEAMVSCEDKHLLVTTNVGDDGIVWRIQDTGAGISKKTGERIFEPFFTTKETWDYNGQAQTHAGLGLSHVSHLLAKYNGKISYKSDTGETVFTIVLPHPS